MYSLNTKILILSDSLPTFRGSKDWKKVSIAQFMRLVGHCSGDDTFVELVESLERTRINLDKTIPTYFEGYQVLIAS